MRPGPTAKTRPPARPARKAPSRRGPALHPWAYTVLLLLTVALAAALVGRFPALAVALKVCLLVGLIAQALQWCRAFLRRHSG
jgi:hypothetical protein